MIHYGPSLQRREAMLITAAVLVQIYYTIWRKKENILYIE